MRKDIFNTNWVERMVNALARLLNPAPLQLARVPLADPRKAGSVARDGRMARRAQRGFSLIEMLLVLGIIAFIATMLATNIFSGKARADYKAAQTGVRKVAMAVDQYYLDAGSLPNKIEELVTRPGSASNWSGPYLSESQIKDPWGMVYTLKVPGDNGLPYAVISYGQDKAPGGKDLAADIDNNQ